jgi:glycosyltransferase involved in cell wall biosynthesis
MTSPLRLLIVGPLPPPSGGMANQTLQLAGLLRREGVDVRIVRTNAPYRPGWVGAVPVLRAAFRLVPYLATLRAECRRAEAVHVMANSGLAWYLFAVPAIAAARRERRRIVVNYRGGLAAEFLARAADRVRRSLRDTTLVVPSPFLREVFARHGMTAEIIPNVVDTTVFTPTPRRTVGSLAAPHVVVPRNLEHIYGIDLALRAFSLLRRTHPGARCSIAGTGPERARLQALAREFQVDGCTEFTGRLDVAGMVALYHSADVVLNPVRVDNTPNSVLEALACRIPVVSTSVGGVPHLVQHGVSALLTDPESPEALAEAVRQLADDEALRARLVAGGEALVANFTWERVRDRWLRAYTNSRGLD